MDRIPNSAVVPHNLNARAFLNTINSMRLCFCSSLLPPTHFDCSAYFLFAYHTKSLNHARFLASAENITKNTKQQYQKDGNLCRCNTNQESASLDLEDRRRSNATHPLSSQFSQAAAIRCIPINLHASTLRQCPSKVNRSQVGEVKHRHGNFSEAS